MVPKVGLAATYRSLKCHTATPEPMVSGDSPARTRATTHRATSSRKRKSKRNEPGLFGSMLHYIAQEAHSFVTNLSCVNEDLQDQDSQGSEEGSEEVRNKRVTHGIKDSTEE